MSEHSKLELSPSVSIIIAGVIIAGAIVFVNQHPAVAAPAANAAAPTATATANVPAPNAADHIQGSLTAPIVLVEYSDFQCPFCQMIDPTLNRIVSESNGQISWIYRQFPLYQIHPNALPAAEASECIAEQLGNDGFWKFVADDFANQANIGSAFFAAEAQKLGADMTKYNACVSANKYSSKITTQIGEAEAAGGNGTPFTVVVNTKTGKQTPISGALPYEQVMAVINAAK